jgi:hypothetical protein
MRAILIFATICLFIVTSQAQNTQEAEKVRQIEGFVTDFFGVPWEGAIVKLKSKGAVYKSSIGGKTPIFEMEAKTDSNGIYRFSDLPEDAYEITLLRMGTTLEETKQTHILIYRKVYRVDFGVEVGWISECQYFVGGVVKDEKGRKISGAKISAFNAFNQRMLSATTNTEGAYQITICNPGQYVVFANTPKYEVKTLPIVFRSPKDYLKKVDFVLKLFRNPVENKTRAKMINSGRRP